MQMFKKQSQIEDLNILKSAFSYLKPYKRKLIKIIFLMFSSMVISLIQPYLFGKIIDFLSLNNLKDALILILSIGIIYVLGIFFSATQKYLITILASTIEIEVKNNIMKSIFKLNLKDFNQIQHGELINNIENDVRAFSNILTSKLSILIDIISVFVIGIILININIILTMILIMIFPLILITFKKFGQKIRTEEHELKKSIDYYFTFIKESLSSFKLIKIFNSENFQNEKFNNNNKSLYKIAINKSNLNIKADFITQILNLIGYLLILIVGSLQIFSGKLTLGGLVSFNSYSTTFTNSFLKLSQLNAEIQEILVSLKRITELTTRFKHEETPAIISSQQEYSFDSILIKDLSFSYHNSNKCIIKNLNIKIPKNEITILTGSSGSGKTTLMDLIAGLYSDYTGDIYLGEHNIKDIPQDILSKKLCYVTQEHFMFSQTIIDNLLLGIKTTDNKLKSICKKVNMHDYIESLPEKYHTKLGYNGINLSVGQLQRLSIARALLRDSEIYLFDEITSSLDKENENLIEHTIEGLKKEGKIIILITHKQPQSLSFKSTVLKLKNGEVYEVVMQ
ncbi:ABC transporter ATP-binding protein [Lysinibacillus capsici]|uniref:ABC transporter ATP-binding protein n=2 Tax=Lysinibacillus capsici TaxID=2115968 RepID=UPI0028AF9D05|nr:ABC transporter ATP-binding protein [Lysinibacillus capsici]